MANVFFIRTKFIKIEEKKKVVKDYSRDFSKLIFFVSTMFYLAKIFKNKPFEKLKFSQKYFRNYHSRKFISRNFSKMAIRESLSREIAKFRLKPRESLSRESFSH